MISQSYRLLLAQPGTLAGVLTLTSDTILKAIRLPLYPLPYGLFLSKVFEYYKLDFTKEACMDLNHNNIIEVIALHHIGIFLFDKVWPLKDDPHEVLEDIPPLSTDVSTTKPMFGVKPKNPFKHGMM